MSLMMCGLKINKPLCKVHVNCIKCEINKQKDFSFTLLVNHIALMSALQFFKTFYVELSDFIFTFVGQTGSIDSNVFEYVLSVLFEYLFRLFFEKRETFLVNGFSSTFRSKLLDFSAFFFFAWAWKMGTLSCWRKF